MLVNLSLHPHFHENSFSECMVSFIAEKTDLVGQASNPLSSLVKIQCCRRHLPSVLCKEYLPNPHMYSGSIIRGCYMNIVYTCTEAMFTVVSMPLGTPADSCLGIDPLPSCPPPPYVLKAISSQQVFPR